MDFNVLSIYLANLHLAYLMILCFMVRSVFEGYENVPEVEKNEDLERTVNANSIRSYSKSMAMLLNKILVGFFVF